MTPRNRPSLSGSRAKRKDVRYIQSTPSHSGRIASKKAAQSFSYERHHHENRYAFAAERGQYNPSSYSERLASGNRRSASSSVSQYSRNNPHYYKKNEGAQRKKKIMIGVICALVVALIGGGTAFALYVNDINNRLLGTKTDEELRALADVLVPVQDYAEPFYMLLIGSDAREDEDEGGARSDTNILIRVDAGEGTITMVSIMRDTLTTVSGYGNMKFNAVYNYEGAAGTIREASKLCGVDIAHYAEINFEEFVDLVDALGGVEVDVPELIDDPDAGPAIIGEGPQWLYGEAALTFARSRHFADGDFSRVSNQRLLIEALFKRVISLPMIEMIGAIEAATACLTTDMKVEDLVSLARQLRTHPEVQTYSVTVPSAPAMIDEVSYVIVDAAALQEMMMLVSTGKDPSGIVATNAYYPSSGTGVTNTQPEPYYDPYYEDPGTSVPYEEPPPGGDVDVGPGGEGEE
ncbi:MAG: LCP family protein [Eggerthellaceae bacterium]|nr:LCP family protein [Eggerthellaceae bacterium]